MAMRILLPLEVIPCFELMLQVILKASYFGSARAPKKSLLPPEGKRIFILAWKTNSITMLLAMYSEQPVKPLSKSIDLTDHVSIMLPVTRQKLGVEMCWLFILACL